MVVVITAPVVLPNTLVLLDEDPVAGPGGPGGAGLPNVAVELIGLFFDVGVLIIDDCNLFLAVWG